MIKEIERKNMSEEETESSEFTTEDIVECLDELCFELDEIKDRLPYTEFIEIHLPNDDALCINVHDIVAIANNEICMKTPVTIESIGLINECNIPCIESTSEIVNAIYRDVGE